LLSFSLGFLDFSTNFVQILNQIIIMRLLNNVLVHLAVQKLR
jgi:hypothetical protein